MTWAPMVLATACTCVRDEARYLGEWAAHHLIAGFDRVVIYDNDSSDGSEALLDMMSADPRVARFSWPTTGRASPQMGAFAHAAGHLAGRTRFVAFLDADEFLMPDPGFDLRAFLQALPDDASAVAVNQRVFGSGGRISAGQGGVLERFARANAATFEENSFYKSIFRPERIAAVDDPHHFALSEGHYVTPQGQRAALRRDHPGRTREICTKGLSVRHYMLKSREEFEIKRRRGGGMGTSLALRRARFDEAYFTERDKGSNKAHLPCPPAHIEAVERLARRLADGPAAVQEQGCAAVDVADFVAALADLTLPGFGLAATSGCEWRQADKPDSAASMRPDTPLRLVVRGDDSPAALDERIRRDRPIVVVKSGKGARWRAPEAYAETRLAIGKDEVSVWYPAEASSTPRVIAEASRIAGRGSVAASVSP